MPITQDRMIALIKVCNEFSDHLEQTHNAIADAIARKRAGAKADDELELLLSLTQAYRPSVDAIRTLAIEESHFAAMHYHNTMSRQRMAAKRLEQGSFHRRHPRQEAVLHRVNERAADLSARHDAIPPFEMTPEQFAKLEQELAAEQRATQAPKAEGLPANQNPELFHTHDAEAVEIEEVWKAEPNSIIGS